MNMLPRTCLRQFIRFAQTAAAPTKLLAEQLQRRALIRVHGEEVVPFLQGLITNDIYNLHRDGNPAIFTMFLNNAGRVLYDAIIYKTLVPDTFLIECDREVSNELRRHLRVYRVRKQIDIDCINSDFTPWVVFNPDEDGEFPAPNPKEVKAKDYEILCTPDPRVKEMGVRIIQPQDNQIKDIAKLFPDSNVEHSENDRYSTHRYINGVGEGVDDHPPGKCFPLEANCDLLHGVSFQKGCYVGQELTARVYHTGVIRKRLMPLKLTSELDEDVDTVQTPAGSVVGTVRGVSDMNALALLRVEQVLHTRNLMIDGEMCTAIRPRWWPRRLPHKQSLARE